MIGTLGKARNKIQEIDRFFHRDFYIYVLGLNVAKKLCEEVDIEIESPAKEYKIGEVFGIEVRYNPLVENDNFYLMKRVDYEKEYF